MPVVDCDSKDRTFSKMKQIAVSFPALLFFSYSKFILTAGVMLYFMRYLWSCIMSEQSGTLLDLAGVGFIYFPLVLCCFYFGCKLPASGVIASTLNPSMLGTKMQRRVWLVVLTALLYFVGAFDPLLTFYHEAFVIRTIDPFFGIKEIIINWFLTA
ncbi:hypothetical protein [Photobacterium kishitanii]|uniref:Uncharacterized protein n=1 Tax=Photobacterium kishitanii TaxID=318456 RepID=A0A2T3KAZ2_9GAMM|nr:hypothetical protein [Photobacterium kishitanii]PSU89784.1 hypothetical protein C9J27_24185 [Photobacterium kishitanii]